MMSERAAFFCAVDLGASSGRVLLGRLASGRFELAETARFATPVLKRRGHLQWDFDGILVRVVDGLRAAERLAGSPLASVGIDTWGVDYGRLTPGATLLEPPFHYRDARTRGVPERLFADLPAATLYARTGVQVQPFNTVFQLAASAGDPAWDVTARLLLMPDLIASRLTGVSVTEVTNASTTGLLDPTTRSWSRECVDELAALSGLPLSRVLTELVEPGTFIGTTLPGVLAHATPVVAVGSHDTASAVVAVPTQTRDFAFVSSGTWSLVGLELERPVLSEDSRQANFTNELGVDGTVRYLKNVMGLWVLNECRRQWAQVGMDIGLDTLLDEAATLTANSCVIDAFDERLLAPSDMLAQVRVLAGEAGGPIPETPAAVTRCVLDSLAAAYGVAVDEAARLAGRDIDVVHIVGGGSQNRLLCQMTADVTGRAVIAGPTEGTALGNLLVQARAVGALQGDLLALRRVAAASSELTTYRPRASGPPIERTP